MNFIKKLEEEILEQEPLKLDSYFEFTSVSLETFIREFISTFNQQHTTVYIESGRDQCTPKRKRSLGDIFLICRFYFPKCSLEEVIKILYHTLMSHSENVGTWYCSYINKRVWFPEKYGAFYNERSLDEYGNLPSRYLEVVRSNQIYA